MNNLKKIERLFRRKGYFGGVGIPFSKSSGKSVLLLILVFTVFGIYQAYISPVTNERVLITSVVGDIKCVDGDTFWVGDEKIRLLAVDTPETVHPSKPEEPYGKEASEMTCTLIMEAETLKFEQDKGNEIDKYDRSLYWVYVDDELLQAILIDEGLAKLEYIDKKTIDTNKYELLLKKQSEAEYNKVGIWSI